MLAPVKSRWSSFAALIVLRRRLCWSVRRAQVAPQPNVIFDFTPSRRVAFEDLTRAVAYRGWARAIGPVTGEQAEALSGHIALVYDDEVMTRPIINFAENPDGIDGRVGARISGGFSTVKEAQDLAATLRIGALPINLALIQREVSGGSPG